MIFHETVHFWQYLASGYLARLVEEDWDRLVAFERSGKTTHELPRRSHFLQRHPEHGFAPRDLVEAFARYWDVHVIGPPNLLEQELHAGRHVFSQDFVDRYHELNEERMLRHPEYKHRGYGYTADSFDLAMEGPAGSSAKPYVQLRERLPPKTIGGLFPIAVHLALQTTDPVGTFASIFANPTDIDRAFPNNNDIAVLWRLFYDGMSGGLDTVPKDRVLGSGIDVARSGTLRANPVWRWLIKSTDRAASVYGMKRLLYALSCPGDRDNKRWLLPRLAPLLVQFADGTEWNPAQDVLLQFAAENKWVRPEGVYAEGARLARVAELAREVGDRWQSFLRSANGY